MLKILIGGGLCKKPPLKPKTLIKYSGFATLQNHLLCHVQFYFWVEWLLVIQVVYMSHNFFYDFVP